MGERNLSQLENNVWLPCEKHRNSHGSVGRFNFLQGRWPKRLNSQEQGSDVYAEHLGQGSGEESVSRR